jgi:hypothetical protein
LDGHEELPAWPRSPSHMERGELRRIQQSCHHRRRGLHAQRRGLPDAHQEEPGAAEFEIFQTSAEVRTGGLLHRESRRNEEAVCALMRCSGAHARFGIRIARRPLPGARRIAIRAESP